MEFFRSKTLFGCGIIEDGDRLLVAILVVSGDHTPGPCTVYAEGDRDRPFQVDAPQLPGFYTAKEGEEVVVMRVNNAV